ncbi:MAG: hypothetical protein JWO44_637 [Bacteroidetes bacterium]|nr:hypothetical protein [Bacteroidota bacterium]
MPWLYSRQENEQKKHAREKPVWESFQGPVIFISTKTFFV